MARIRTIKPEFFDDPEVGDLSPWARLFFIGLWTQADREGRIAADWRRLKARLFPYDAKCPELSRLAVELHGKDMVRHYQDTDGRDCLWIVNFLTHQRPHPKEPASTIEPWPGREKTEEKPKAVEKHGEPGKDTASRVDNGLWTMDHGSGEGNGSLAMDHGDAPAVAVGDGFADFWEQYPNHKSRAAAEKAWRRLAPGAELREAIAAALAWQTRSVAWLKDGGGFVPHAATWINGRKWEDEAKPGDVVTDDAEAFVKAFVNWHLQARGAIYVPSLDDRLAAARLVVEYPDAAERESMARLLLTADTKLDRTIPVLLHHAPRIAAKVRAAS